MYSNTTNPTSVTAFSTTATTYEMFSTTTATNL
jgi:hypothetical protein